MSNQTTPIDPKARPCQCYGHPINWIAEIGGFECGCCGSRWPHRLDMTPVRHPAEMVLDEIEQIIEREMGPRWKGCRDAADALNVLLHERKERP